MCSPLFIYFVAIFILAKGTIRRIYVRLWPTAWCSRWCILINLWWSGKYIQITHSLSNQYASSDCEYYSRTHIYEWSTIIGFPFHSCMLFRMHIFFFCSVSLNVFVYFVLFSFSNRLCKVINHYVLVFQVEISSFLACDHFHRLLTRHTSNKLRQTQSKFCSNQ